MRIAIAVALLELALLVFVPAVRLPYAVLIAIGLPVAYGAWWWLHTWPHSRN